ncbi:MAG: hypothetical protein ABIQ27_01170 [Flavobacterium sp.]|uniref:hypothetical protein n=1 Tax=Flavobacterium sp. TaxID=239 RepID=UPI003267BEC1
MNPNKPPTKPVPFAELVAVSPTESTNKNLDVLIEEQITLENYCNALIDKLLKLSQTQFLNFINHQLEQVKSPLDWLDSFDLLIAENEKLFTENGMLFKYNKLFNLIEKKRDLLQCSTVKPSKPTIAKRYINAESEDRYFSFHEIKKQLSILEDDNEKILLLTKEKHEYKQANIEFLNQKIPLFDKQCSKEIEQIYEMQTIKSSIDKLKPATTIHPSSFNKLQFNCNVNQFVDIFYQLSRELFVDGKPMIEGNMNDMAAMIVSTFLDKDGRELNPMSVQTILKPSREDKRPNTNKRIDIKKLL